VAGKKSRKAGSSTRAQKKIKHTSTASNPRYSTMLTQAIGHHQQGNLAEAESIYRTILSHEPTHADALHLLGLVHAQTGHYVEAIKFYDQALLQEPDFAGAYNNRGIALNAMRKYQQAVESFQKSLKLDPSNSDTHHNLANALNKLGRLDEAIQHYKKSLKVKPDNKNAYNSLALAIRKICDWSEYSQFETEIIRRSQSSRSSLMPFCLLNWSDDPDNQLQCAATHAKNIIPANLQQINPAPSLPQGRIRIGYISTDFREHVVSHMIVELFEQHDRGKFEIFGFSLGGEESSPMRTRVRSAFDHFTEVEHLGDSQIASLIAEQGIHILVDLNGYSAGSRPCILAMRPAPIQINYLGYIGTMGADFIDYIIVDDFCVPERNEQYFTEKLLHLPCYMVNDRQRTIADKTPTRAEVELPEDGFVFCSFNNSYKLTPQFFDIWMRCLRAVPRSVLWLLAGNEQMQTNLRREAQDRGVDPTRLIFAPRVEASQHLARHRLADLFLDTLPVNAGATAIDALWMGLPPLTCPGNSFVARMCGGLLHSAGLPELAVDTLEEYERLAIQLAQSPEKIAALRKRLTENRDTLPLFNSQEFCNNFEAALTNVWNHWRDSLANNTSTDTLDSDKLKSMLEEAVALHQQGELDTAELRYREVLKINQREADALHLLGVIHAQRGHLDQAIDLYQQSIEANPELVGAYSNLGIALFSAGKQQEAIECLRKSIEMMPNADAHYNLANCLYGLQQYEEAIENYQQALVLNPAHQHAQRNMNASLKKLGR